MKTFPTYSYRTDQTVPQFMDDKPIIVFDGVCALCSGWVDFVLRHDKVGRYRFLSAQSTLGKAIYVHYGLDPSNYETNILIDQGVAWFRLDGSVRMAEGLGFPWRLAFVFKLLPRPMKDALYHLIARNRYRWFGRRTTCYMPSDQFQDRFLA